MNIRIQAGKPLLLTSILVCFLAKAQEQPKFEIFAPVVPKPPLSERTAPPDHYNLISELQSPRLNFDTSRANLSVQNPVPIRVVSSDGATYLTELPQGTNVEMGASANYLEFAIRGRRESPANSSNGIGSFEAELYYELKLPSSELELSNYTIKEGDRIFLQRKSAFDAFGVVVMSKPPFAPTSAASASMLVEFIDNIQNFNQDPAICTNVNSGKYNLLDYPKSIPALDNFVCRFSKLPAATEYDKKFRRQLLSYIRAASRATGQNEALSICMALQESDFDTQAHSSADARGILQTTDSAIAQVHNMLVSTENYENQYDESLINEWYRYFQILKIEKPPKPEELKNPDQLFSNQQDSEAKSRAIAISAIVGVLYKKYTLKRAYAAFREHYENRASNAQLDPESCLNLLTHTDLTPDEPNQILSDAYTPAMHSSLIRYNAGDRDPNWRAIIPKLCGNQKIDGSSGLTNQTQIYVNSIRQCLDPENSSVFRDKSASRAQFEKCGVFPEDHFESNRANLEKNIVGGEAMSWKDFNSMLPPPPPDYTFPKPMAKPKRPQ